MIVLDRIDPVRHQVAWSTVVTELPGAETQESVDARTRALGMHASGDWNADDATGSLEHSWSAAVDSVEYTLRVPVTRLAPADVSFYLGAALATLTWVRLDDLLSLHLAAYELTVNVHDHGRPLPGEDAEFRLSIHARRDRIEMTMIDGCEDFDPASRPPIDLSARIRRREKRGYGVALVQRAVDDIHHEHGDAGNVVCLGRKVNP